MKGWYIHILPLHAPRLVRFCLTLIAISVADAPCSEAQSVFGADLAIDYPHTWRGRTLSEGITAEPRAWLNWRGVSSGWWGLFEPMGARPNRLAVRGRHAVLLSAADMWIDGTLTARARQLTAGIVRHRFRGDSLGVTKKSNGDEFYLELAPPAHLALVESLWYRLRYFQGIRGWETHYGEVEIGRQSLILPIKNMTLTPHVLAGFNVTRSRVVPPFGDTHQSRGLTHWQIAATLAFAERCDRSRWTWVPDLFAAYQKSNDKTTPDETEQRNSSTRVILQAQWWPHFCATNR